MRLTTVITALGIYLLQTLVAFARQHRNRQALAKVNVFGGWTLFGWITALVWSLYPEPSSYPRCRFQGAPAVPPRPSNGAERATPDTPRGMPKLSGHIRPLIPQLGLRNYWYPAIPAARVGREYPLQVSMLGVVTKHLGGRAAAFEAHVQAEDVESEPSPEHRLV